MGAMFSSRDDHPSPADAAHGEDLAFYLQLDLDHEPKDVVEVGVGNSGAALRAVLAAKPKSLHARELSEKNRKRLEKEFAKEVESGVMTISGSATPRPLPLDDASVDIIYGLHGLHCMESFSVVHAEMLRLLRPGGKLVWACGSYGPEGEGGSRVLAGAMRAAGFVDVKIDVTRLQGAARWTPVVGAKAR